MYKEYLAYNQTPERTASIMTDEASAVHKGMLYKEVFPNDTSWYSANSLVEMGDLIVMAKLLCEQNNWDIEKIEELGKKRFLQRMKELKRGKQD